MKGKPLDLAVVSRLEAQLAYEWTTASNLYPVQPVGDAVAASVQMLNKYSSYFATCASL